MVMEANWVRQGEGSGEVARVKIKSHEGKD